MEDALTKGAVQIDGECAPLGDEEGHEGESERKLKAFYAKCGIGVDDNMRLTGSVQDIIATCKSELRKDGIRITRK